MKSITQSTGVENEFSTTVEAFFRTFKLGAILKKSGAYKKRRLSALNVFRKLFELVFIHKSLFEALRMEKKPGAAKDTFYQFMTTDRKSVV